MNQRERIEEALQELLLLLERVKEKQWSTEIRKMINKPNNDLHEMKKSLLTWFGGMGSLNDLIISNVNGHLIDSQDEDEVNSRFCKIKENLYLLINEF